MERTSYSSKFDLKKESELRKRLEENGFEIKPFDHAFWRAQNKNVNVTLYKSGKILVQGKGTENFIINFLNETPQLSLGLSVPEDEGIKHDFDCWIGTDESGKGDYFGPLVVASVLVDETNRQKFIEFGIKDSKKLSDENIEKLAWKIKANSIFSIVTINPAKYNELYSKFNNYNKLLAWGHAQVIENIIEKKVCLNAISDKFGDESLIKNALLKKNININLIQKVRAESDIAVAAASVLARNEFVQRIKKLSSQYGIEFPKGASSKVIEQARLFVDKYDLKQLGNVAKLHFKTTDMLHSQTKFI